MREKDIQVHYELEPIGECYALYVEGKYIKTFSGFAESYRNLQDAEDYVKTHYAKENTRESEPNLSSLNTMEAMVHDGVYFIERNGEKIALTPNELHEIDLINRAWDGKCIVEQFQESIEDKDLLYVLTKDVDTLAEIDSETIRMAMETMESIQEEIILNTLDFYKDDFLESLPTALAKGYFNFLKDCDPYEYYDAKDEIVVNDFIEDVAKRIQNGDVEEFIEEMDLFLEENEEHEDYSEVKTLKEAFESYHRRNEKTYDRSFEER